MDNINYTDIGFTWRSIVPEEGDSVTSLWGRKFAKNCFSVQGMIGTLNFPGELDANGYIVQSVNLGLTSKFEFPPFVELYYRNPTSGLLEKFDDSPKKTFLFASPSAKIGGLSYWIDGDNLCVKLERPTVYQVYYRVLGL